MLELTVRLVVSLSLIVGLLLLLTRLGARRFAGKHGALIQVVHRQALSRSASVSVVTVGGRVLVLGTTEHQVNVLSELDPDELELAELAEMMRRAEEAEDEVSADRAAEDKRRADDVLVPAAATLRSRGAHRSAPTPRATPGTVGPLAGSILSPQTWRQAISAATGRTT